jgi:2-polyprenyl-3-methyl-5-hydroxy-6-metoxy-1,4-benzoquinol methylase
MSDNSYNKGLFSKGIRSKYHFYRFNWLRSRLTRLKFQPTSILELGCFDAKTIHFLPVKPTRYVGLDANFQGGLDSARKIWKDNNYDFYECHSPDDITINEQFDISICMETLEYVEPEYLNGYVKKLAELTKDYAFVTTSVQKGLSLPIRYFTKTVLGLEKQHYTASELFYSTIGKLNNVKRERRKGWDYKLLLNEMSKHFEIIEIKSYPVPYLLSLGKCILGKKRITN